MWGVLRGYFCQMWQEVVQACDVLVHEPAHENPSICGIPTGQEIYQVPT